MSVGVAVLPDKVTAASNGACFSITFAGHQPRGEVGHALLHAGRQKVERTAQVRHRGARLAATFGFVGGACERCAKRDECKQQD